MLNQTPKIIQESKFIPYSWGQQTDLPRDLAAAIAAMLSEGWELVESEQSQTDDGLFSGYILLQRERPAEPGELPE